MLPLNGAISNVRPCPVNSVQSSSKHSFFMHNGISKIITEYGVQDPIPRVNIPTFCPSHAVPSQNTRRKVYTVSSPKDISSRTEEVRAPARSTV